MDDSRGPGLKFASLKGMLFSSNEETAQNSIVSPELRPAAEADEDVSPICKKAEV